MKKSRFSETQIVKILKEAEEGRTVKEVCREYAISEVSYYNWKDKEIRVPEFQSNCHLYGQNKSQKV